jgi:LysM repeat protein
MKSILLFLGLVGIPWMALGNDAPHITREEYIESWKDEAIYQMALHKIPASITLAQGILESGDGNSRLATEANNHFGIKCHTDWNGAKIFEDDDAKSECFRKYDDARASYEDHSLFLQRKRYESLFDLDTDDYKAWAKGLKNCGYATNPKYPELLIKLIEEFELHTYDDEGMKHIKNKTSPDRKAGKAIAQTRPSTKEERKDKSRGAKNKSTETPREITLSNRTVSLSDNHIKYIAAKAGDTPEKIAEDLGLNPWQIKKYNDLESLQTTFKAGEKIYIQPKRNHGAHATYTVQKNDNLRSISQQVGVKMKALKKMNPSINGQSIEAGTTLKLRK